MSNNSDEEMFYKAAASFLHFQGGELAGAAAGELRGEDGDIGAWCSVFPTGFPMGLGDAAWRGSPRAQPLLPSPQVLQYHRDPPSPPPGCREEEDVTQELHVLPALES